MPLQWSGKPVDRRGRSYGRTGRRAEDQPSPPDPSRHKGFSEPLSSKIEKSTKPTLLQTPTGFWKVEKNQDNTYSLFYGMVKYDTQPASRPMSAQEVEQWGQQNQAVSVSESVEKKSALNEVRKMKSSDIVKKDLLRRKIREHFSKNPRSKSVIVKADIGDKKTIWRARRLSENNFNIVEVNTTREEFMITEDVRIGEQGEKEDEPKKKEKAPEKKASKPDMPKPTPPADAKPAGAEMAASPTEPSAVEPVDKPETDLDASPEGAPEGPEMSAEEEPGIKTAEEDRLKKMIVNKPIQDISVSSDSDRGTITLTLGGLKNPVEISVFDNGKVTYKLGSLSQLLKPSA